MHLFKNGLRETLQQDLISIIRDLLERRRALCLDNFHNRAHLDLIQQLHLLRKLNLLLVGNAMS